MKTLYPIIATSESVDPYGFLIQPAPPNPPELLPTPKSESKTSYFSTNEEHPLVLNHGTPSFSIMTLSKPQSYHISKMTRHQKVTQTLGSVGGQEWYLVVCPPLDEKENQVKQVPNEMEIQLLKFRGEVAFQLHQGISLILIMKGTWHAGPFFTRNRMSFYNLKMKETSLLDYHTEPLSDSYFICVDDCHENDCCDCESV